MAMDFRRTEAGIQADGLPGGDPSDPKRSAGVN